MGCTTCTELLNEALNLVVRARQMDAIDRRDAALKISKVPDEWVSSGRFDDYVERHNIENPHKPIASKSGTLHLWVLDQYERDLHSWEEKARKHLMTVDHTAPQERGK
ncbi:hypothetical protein [Brucella pseudogrignonensis]|uniref:hypothetical protein n=1 Tax=Brucella pseudogrignonensis TaxID=419475 RepID=UPI0038CF6689